MVAGTVASAVAGIEGELRALADPKRAKSSAPYLGVRPGGYGEGDVLLGIRVPELRRIARGHRDAPLAVLDRLLASQVHEERFVALAILGLRYEQVGAEERERITRFYLDHRDRVNNWDLVDTSARLLLSDRLRGPEGPKLLNELIEAPNIWERRMAMVGTLSLIRSGDLSQTLRLAGLVLEDGEDLMHKATGWMLREVGKRDPRALKGFLDDHVAEMPRTMLRYAIERLPEAERRRYLAREG